MEDENKEQESKNEEPGKGGDNVVDYVDSKGKEWKLKKNEKMSELKERAKDEDSLDPIAKLRQ